MPDNIKVMISELNGVELDYHQEYDIRLDNILGIDLSSIQPGQQIARGTSGWEIITPVGGNTTHEYFESDNTSSTISKYWQTKISETTANIPTGLYEITYSSELYCGHDNKRIGWQVLLNGSVIASRDNGVRKKKTYKTVSGHKVIQLNSGIYTLEIQYTSPDKKLVRIRNARVNIRSFV